MNSIEKTANGHRAGRVLSHILTLIWMAVIFFMSAQPGDTSGNISGSVSHLFMKIWNVLFFRGWNETEVLQMAEVWDYPIRKLAHMTEFGILAVLVFWTLGAYRRFANAPGREVFGLKYILAWLFAVIYAITDEVHQLFVPDRAGVFTDVLIDSAGAAIGLLVVCGVQLMLRKRREMKAARSESGE